MRLLLYSRSKNVVSYCSLSSHPVSQCTVHWPSITAFGCRIFTFQDYNGAAREIYEQMHRRLIFLNFYTEQSPIQVEKDGIINIYRCKPNVWEGKNLKRPSQAWKMCQVWVGDPKETEVLISFFRRRACCLCVMSKRALNAKVPVTASKPSSGRKLRFQEADIVKGCLIETIERFTL